MKKESICLYDEIYDAGLVEHICSQFGVLPLTARALLRLGLRMDEEIRDFLRPEQATLYDPSQLPDMEKAVSRIFSGLERQERILVFGDYDADGVCATSLLYRTLCLMAQEKNTIGYYVPSRFTEGYGIRPESVERLAQEGWELIVTVDNGITAIDAAARCKELGIELIVTDHHLPEERLPDAYAIVAASRQDSRYPFPSLCGCGIAYKLAEALLPGEDSVARKALTAVATVADVMPLVGENRWLLARSLDSLMLFAPTKKLLDSAGFVKAIPEAGDIAFLLGPRINAFGRMGDAMDAVRLLTLPEDETGTYVEMARKLNDARKSKEKVILDRIEELIQCGTYSGAHCVIQTEEEWHPGVIGIAAGKIAERLHLPTILLSGKGDVLTGSCRSIDGINIFECLTACKELFERFGGHAQAAGITIRRDRLEQLKKEMDGYLAERYDDTGVFDLHVGYSEAVSDDVLTVETIQDLKKLEPYGEGNPAPVFCLETEMLSDLRTIGRDRSHLSAKVNSLRAVWFSAGSRYAELGRLKHAYVFGNAVINEFRGNSSVELMLREVLPIEDEGTLPKVFRAILKDVLYNNGVNCPSLIAGLFATHGKKASEQFSPDRMNVNMLRFRFSKQKRECAGGFLPDQAVKDPFDLWSLALFTERGFFRLGEDGVVYPVDNPEKKKLEDSILYQAVVAALQ